MIHVPAAFIYKGKFIPQGDYEPSSEEEAKDLLASFNRLNRNIQNSAISEQENPSEDSSKKYSEEELNDLIDEAVAVAKSELNNQIADLNNQIAELNAEIDKSKKKVQF